MPLQPGQVLNNRYRIVRLLGQGGFGAVYRAWDTNLNRPCALKENLDTSPEAQRQFTREATVLANLSHPNLPRVTDHFIVPGQGQYLVMDFVEGEDMASLLQKQGAFTLEQALPWILQVAEALSYLHSRTPPVVHRDVKPANIRITPEGKAMLVDFGLVKLFDPHLHTTVGARAVTPGYAPPEQYGQGKTDHRTDQYALAATLYKALTGQEPLESVQRIAGERMPLAHEVNPRIPPPVSMAIERAMRLEPAQRFASVAEFAAALSSSSKPRGVPQPAGVPAGAPGVPPTQVAAAPPPFTPAPQPYPGTVGVPQPYSPQPYPAPGSKPRSTPVTAKGIGIAGAAFISFCLVIAAALGLLVLLPSNGAKKTADAQFQSTLEARVRETSTAQWRATATALQTVQARMTAEAVTAHIDSLLAQRVLVFGPKSGDLPHENDEYIEAYETEVNLRDFVVEARFFNPYPLSVSSWDYGFILRHEGPNKQFRFVVLSDKTWALLNNEGDADGVVIHEGDIPALVTDEGGSNLVRLIFQGRRGYFFLNNAYIAELDLSARMNAGPVFLVTGVYKDDEVEGYSTGFTDFTIWSLP